MKHFYLPFRCDKEKEVSVEGADCHYLTHVLRFKQGASFKGLDVTGRRYCLTIKRIEKDSVLLGIKEEEHLEAEAPLIFLFQAIPKGKVMDRIVRQATEAGIHKIIPVITRYTVVDLKSPKSKNNKVQRWRRIATQAVQQSGGPLLPYIGEPVTITEAIEFYRGDSKELSKEIPQGNSQGIKLFFHQDRKENKALHECLLSNINKIDIFIGPEGGFSDSEYNLLKKKGFIPINLGKNVLRVDTAALYAIAAVKVILLEKKYWRKV